MNGIEGENKNVEIYVANLTALIGIYVKCPISILLLCLRLEKVHTHSQSHSHSHTHS